jgi:uronate dehydrogenase
VDGIVHLGAVSVEESWLSILQANLIGTYNVYEAARQEGFKRVVFASNNHAVSFYPRTRTDLRGCDGQTRQPLRREQGL